MPTPERIAELTQPPADDETVEMLDGLAMQINTIVTEKHLVSLAINIRDTLARFILEREAILRKESREEWNSLHKNYVGEVELGKKLQDEMVKQYELNKQHIKELTAAKSRVAELEKALKFYADNWECEHGEEPERVPNDNLWNDTGWVAIQALTPPTEKGRE